MTISDIIKKAGGPRAIAEASDGAVKPDAVYKWAQIGIPDRHWGILLKLEAATVEELYEANVTARSQVPA